MIRESRQLSFGGAERGTGPSTTWIAVRARPGGVQADGWQRPVHGFLQLGRAAEGEQQQGGYGDYADEDGDEFRWHNVRKGTPLASAKLLNLPAPPVGGRVRAYAHLLPLAIFLQGSG